MEYAITVFILGLMVTALVAKGLFAAQELATKELQRQDEEKRQSALDEKRQATFPN